MTKIGSKNIINKIGSLSSKNIMEVNVVRDYSFMKDINNERYNVNLFINGFVPDNIERKVELAECLINNIENELINKIYILVESKQIDEFKKWLPKKSNKLNIIEMEQRPTYSDFFFSFIVNTKIDDINIIANSDIYFDETLSHLQYMDRQTCYALTRYDIINGKPEFRQREDSQDCWIFKGKHNLSISPECGFYLGVPGCDNKIAYIISRKMGIYNPSLTIKSYHLHKSNERNYLGRLLPPYKKVKPTEIDYVYKETKRKKIYLVGMNLDNQRNMVKAFDEIGICYAFDWRKCKDIHKVRKRILEDVNMINPDLIFFQIQTPDVIEPIMSELKRFRIINWTGDVRKPLPNWYKEIAKHKNVITCFTNDDDVSEIRKMECLSQYLQIGYESDVYNKPFHNKRNIDIVFFGNNYGDRFPLSGLRLEMVKKLKDKYGKRFRLYGTGWGLLADGNLNNNPEEEAEIYGNTNIAIGISHFDYSRYSSDRMYRAMAGGCLYLTKKYPNIEKDFKKMEHLDWWENVDELIGLIDYYLGNGQASMKSIAYKGYCLVRERHTWMSRILDLKRMLRW